MTVNDILLWVAAGGAVLAACLASRPACARPPDPPAWTRCWKGWNAPSALRADIAEGQRGLRGELAESARALRAELGQAQDELRRPGRDAQAARAESAESLARFAAGFGEQLQGLIQINERRLSEVRATVDQRLQLLQADNGARLDEMRRTVDESCTPHWNSGWANRSLVSERLEAVHKGLGEWMLAAGVGDLKRVLTNVKSRGTWARCSWRG